MSQASSDRRPSPAQEMVRATTATADWAFLPSTARITGRDQPDRRDERRDTGTMGDSATDREGSATLPEAGATAPAARRRPQRPQHRNQPAADRRILRARAVPLERLRIESDCQSDDLEHQQRKQSGPADIDQTSPRANGSIIRGETIQWTISPPWQCQSSPRLETLPSPARHMTDSRRTEDQDFDFFFPRRRSASNSRPPPASTKALIPAPTAISGTAEWALAGD